MGEGSLDRGDLRVVAPRRVGVALADDVAALDEHRADPRVVPGRPSRALRLLQRAPHEPLVLDRHRAALLLPRAEIGKLHCARREAPGARS